jgi:hypothetical protein
MNTLFDEWLWEIVGSHTRGELFWIAVNTNNREELFHILKSCYEDGYAQGLRCCREKNG